MKPQYVAMGTFNPLRFAKIISLIQNPRTTYQDLVEFFFVETPPENNDFLSLIDMSGVSERTSSKAYHETIAIEDNPNPEAAIAFLIHYPFQYYIYKNIYRHLFESEYVIDGQWIRRNIESWESFVPMLASFLKKEGVRFRIFTGNMNQEEFFKNYEILVAYTRTPPMDFPCNKTKKKVRVLYGHSKDLWNFGVWSRAFDLALTYGPYSNKAIDHYTESVITGNARFDDWFNGQVSGKNLTHLTRKLDSGKKTLLYSPTHRSLSSLEIMAPAIPRLLEKYNLIIRPHQLTLYTERERLEKFKQEVSKNQLSSQIIWTDDLTDSVHLLAVSDLMISDNSGAIFDAVLADKPLVLVDILKENFFEEEMENIKRLGMDLWLMPLTYPQSIEQRVKHEDDIKIGETVEDINKLELAVSRAFELSNDYYAPRRKKVREMLFSFTDGSAGKRGAEAIRALLHKEKRSAKFLSIQAEIEIKTRIKYAYDLLDNLRKSANWYFNTSSLEEKDRDLNEIRFSVVMPTYNSGSKIISALTALASQDIDSLYYEIIIIDDASRDNTGEVIKNFIENNPNLRISYLLCGQNRGPAHARNIGIANARGKYIAFTDDDCMVPPHWLSDFEKDFNANPEIAGSGGYIIPSSLLKSNGTKADRLIISSLMPFLKQAYKSAVYNPRNHCGDSGNICYRKSILKSIGGFDPYFRFATTEDLELKTRLHENLHPLFYTARAVEHLRIITFYDFCHYWLLRGWGAFLMHKKHPQYTNFDFSFIKIWPKIILEIRNLSRNKEETISAYGFEIENSKGITPKFMIVLKYLMLWSGRYWIPLTEQIAWN